MQHFKSTGTATYPNQTGSWLAGMLIGAVILTMATQAILLGAGTAIQEATSKRN